jgi:hypothetical protein
MTIYIQGVDITKDGKVRVSGQLSATNLLAALHARVYVQPPPDGIWDYDLVETASGPIGGAMMVPFAVDAPWTGPADAKGVRVHNASPAGNEPATTVVASGRKVADFTTTVENHIRIVSAAVVAGVLVVDVEYGGGCFEHIFSLEWDGATLKSMPPQYRLNLVDESPYDPCRAIIGRRLRFDISIPAFSFESPSTLRLAAPGGQEIPVAF